MSATAGAQGHRLAWRLTVVPSLPSTSAFCCERAAGGEPAGLAVLAQQQTAGRGSRGRTWSSAPGSLALSVLLRPDGPAAASGQWALLAGVAMHEGLAGFLPDAPTVIAGLDPAIPVRRRDGRINSGHDGDLGSRDQSGGLTLKWPNDLLLNGHKLGGILVESAATPDRRIAWLVLGLGANLAEAPAIPGQPTAAALVDCAPAPAPEQVAAAILDRISHWDRELAQHGFAPIRDAWLARAHPIGTALRIGWRDGAETYGRFAGLGEDGALLLQTADGLRTYSTGEVLLGAGARPRPLVETAGAPT